MPSHPVTVEFSRSAVPSGRRPNTTNPNVETLGYYQASLRGEDEILASGIGQECLRYMIPSASGGAGADAETHALATLPAALARGATTLNDGPFASI